MRTKDERRWVRVRRDEPCKVCGSVDYCTRSADGKAARCMRVESSRVSNSAIGIGWIHELDQPLPVAKPKPEKKLADVSAVAKKMYLDRLASGKRTKLAAELGVPKWALASLRVGIGWDYDGREFSSWPARDSDGNVIGITRRYDDGEKKTMAGTSNAGVFVPECWWKAAGPTLIVEGGSDTAALVGNFFCALGRPSNVGGAKIIAALLDKRRRGQRAVVIGENDRKPERMGTVSSCDLECVGCAWCWPGRFGAERVARMLGCEWKMIPPIYKDVRVWASEDLDFKASFAAFIGG